MTTGDRLPVIQDGKQFIKEPQTAVSPSFGLISVVHFNDGELDDCLHLLINHKLNTCGFIISEDAYGGSSLIETERSQWKRELIAMSRAKARMISKKVGLTEKISALFNVLYVFYKAIQPNPKMECRGGAAMHRQPLNTKN